MKLNLHCHSAFSDGVLSPEALAGTLADQGVAVAALTDHDTVEGSVHFREALSLRGVAYVDAVELTTFCSFGEIHILAYGIDIASPELLKTLSLARNAAKREPQGFLDHLRNIGASRRHERLETAAAIALTHRCGGIAVLAHPLDIRFDSGDLGSLLDSLSSAGLDGIEAYYGPYSREDRAKLVALAENRGLCVSMGTDFHAPDDPSHSAVLDADEKVWRAFRDRLLRRLDGSAVVSTDDSPTDDSPKTAPNPDSLSSVKRRTAHSGFKFGKFSARIIAASILALGLFVIALFAISIPYFEKTLLDRKKEMIRELTAEAVSLIAEYAADETSGRTSREAAQRDAAAHIRNIRYGHEGKDYFWITDSIPRMVMHPYRTELEGTDVSYFQDDNGLRVFYEFTRAVREKDEGYVEYLWQWKDDASRIVPKLSFVKRFEPWGWIIGTGIYLDDVKREIDALSGRMILLSVLIAMILLCLLAFIAQQSVRMEKEKSLAEFAVRESKERYRALVEASSEGMAIVIDGVFTFANTPFLELSGYSATEIVLLSISEFLVPYEDEGASVTTFLASLPINAAPESVTDAEASSIACLFKRRSGELIDIVAHSSFFSLAGKKGAVLSVKDARVENPENDVGRLFSATIEVPADNAFLSSKFREEALRMEASSRFPDERLPLPPSSVTRIFSNETVRSAAERMTRNGCDALIVQGAAGEDIGIITDKDIRSRIVAENRDADLMVGQAMSAPLVSLKADATCGQALFLMREKGVGHIVVRDAANVVTAVVGREDLSRVQADGFSALIAAAASARDPGELGRIRERMVVRARLLAADGLRPKIVTGLVSSVGDAIISRLLNFAETDLGPAPAPYVFLTLGSGGRSEALPASDQDNAIVYETPRADDGGEKKPDDAVRAYFRRLGAYVCDSLHEMGVPYCPGGVMAKNEKWCAPLSEWERKFAAWIRTPEAEEMLSLNLSFDFRALGGDFAIAASLKSTVSTLLAETPSFFTHLARDAVRRHTNFPQAGTIFQGGAGEPEVDLKEIAARFVIYARLYALRDGIEETNTYKRVEALTKTGTFGSSLAEEFLDVYEVLSGLRIARHEGFKVPLKALKPREEAALRTAFAQASLIQKKIAFDFPGAAI